MKTRTQQDANKNANNETKQTEKQGESEIKMISGSISLPSEVAPEKAHATLKNGTLEIVAPKSTTETAKTLAVSAA